MRGLLGSRSLAVMVAGITAVTAQTVTAQTAPTAPLFSEGFEGSLAAQWTGKGGGSTSGVIVADPVRPANNVLSFGALAAGGDIFSNPIAVTKSANYRLSFDYLGRPNSGGGIIGVSLGTPDHHRWLAGTAGGKGAGEKNPLVVDGAWHSYNVDFSPGDHTWFTADGGQSVDPGAITSLRIMLEANWGTAGDAYFDNISLTRCAGTCSASADEPLPPVAGPSDPVVGQTANVAAVEPGVLVKEPGKSTFTTLSNPRQITMGSIIDARKGRVRISVDDGKGGIDTADFFEGVFRLTQGKKGTRFATLTLVGGSFKGCPRAPKARLSGKSKGGSVRHLWGSGSGSFRTVGRFSAASLRGTTWLTDDKCNGTLTRVTKGSVTVRDFVRRRSVVVKAPGSYLARS